MVNGLCVDRETQWSISGMDVKPFPESKPQARFVRRKLNAGVLEAASAAEHEEAHPESYGEDDDEGRQQADSFMEALRAASMRGGSQEHKLRERETARTAAMRETRRRAKLEEEGIDPDDSDSLDEASYESTRKRRIKAIEEAEDRTDDPVEQKERTATRARNTTKKSAARRAKPSEDEGENEE